MRSSKHLAPLVAAPLLAAGIPAPIADAATAVTHGYTHTEFFPDDICGARASTATFTETMAQSQYVQRADGSWSYRDVSVVTYVGDYVDPSIADVTGRLTEVNHYIFRAPESFIAATSFHDFGGDLKIWERVNFKAVKGEVVVDRELVKVTGCP
jgi:hypothetical protein